MSQSTTTAYRRERKRLRLADPVSKEKDRLSRRANARTIRSRWMFLKGVVARRNGRVFDLTLEQYSGLVRGNACTYCDNPLPPVGGGLDRINSGKGYTVDNVVPCCRSCNEIRGHDNITYEEMFHVIKLLKKLRRRPEAL